MMRNKTTEQNYFNFLMELHALISSKEKFGICALCKKHHVHTMASVVLQEGKIIRKSGGREVVKYDWISVPPNMQMAKKTMNKVLDYGKENATVKKVDSKSEPIKKKVKTPIVNAKLNKIKPMPVERERGINILWGAIKITL